MNLCPDIKTTILIVSYKRDFRYLKYCLRSVQKFCSGFAVCRVFVPEQDVQECEALFTPKESMPITVSGFNEWPGKGMLHHMLLVLHADELCPESDLILHTDSDCVFTKPITPESFMVEGKPILYYASYRWLITQQANLSCWQDAVERALGWRPLFEFMRRHPAVHWRQVYAKTRALIEDYHKISVAEFMQKQRNEFPQSFAEYPTLGEVAWNYFKKQYHWIDQQNNELDKSHIHQAWSHRDPVQEDMLVYEKLGIL